MRRTCVKAETRAARDRARLESEMEAYLQEALMDRFLEKIPQEKYARDHRKSGQQEHLSL